MATVRASSVVKVGACGIDLNNDRFLFARSYGLEWRELLKSRRGAGRSKWSLNRLNQGISELLRRGYTAQELFADDLGFVHVVLSSIEKDFFVDSVEKEFFLIRFSFQVSDEVLNLFYSLVNRVLLFDFFKRFHKNWVIEQLSFEVRLDQS